MISNVSKPKTVSKREASRSLGYSVNYVQKLIERGNLEAVKSPSKGRPENRVLLSSVRDMGKSLGTDDESGKTISPEQAADVLNVSIRTIWRYLSPSDGRLTPIRRAPHCYVRIRLKQVVGLAKTW